MRQIMRLASSLFLTFLAGAAAPYTTWAQTAPSRTGLEKRELQFSLGAGFITSPRPYVGTNARVIPIPVLDLRYKRFFVQGIRFGYEVVERGPLTASVLTQARFAGLEPEDSPFLEGMETRRKSADGGIEVLYRGRPVGFRAVLLTDILGRSNGQILSATAVTGAPLGKVLVWVGAGPTWYSQRRADYYYRVRDDEARPGRPAYTAEATVNFDLNLTVRFAPNDRWSLFVLVNREALGSSIQNSPIVGRNSAVGVVTSFTYSF
jgi:outer membrane protein